MTKTRRKSLMLSVKKEEREDKYTPEKDTLHGINNTSKSENKITKNRTLTQAQIAKVKPKNDDDNKVLLASPKKKTLTASKITTEQLKKLIDYIVKDKMSVTAASKKVGISTGTALSYYHEYQDDPEHKIPLPKTGFSKRSSTLSQEKIDNLIRYIVKDQMNVNKASKKAGINRITAARYYAKYLEDPDRKIPSCNILTGNAPRKYTQKEVTDLIGYIVRNKMTVAEASRKVNMSPNAAKRYYVKYLQDPNQEIPDPSEFNQRCGKRCTDDQVKSLIEYIVNDGMSLVEASVKVNMSYVSASKYYKQYLNDPESNIPTPETHNGCTSNNTPTVDQVKDFFCYIIVDKSPVLQAARKANISENTGQILYRRYLKNPIQEITIKDMSYSVEKMKNLVKLVQNEKISLGDAADVVHLNHSSARVYYKQYLKNPQNEFPTSKQKHYTQEDTKRLINYTKDKKMSVLAAAKSINMERSTAYKYYNEYQNDPEHKIPVPHFNRNTSKSKAFDMCPQIIADIYKSNPLVKPIYGNHDPELNGVDIKIKEELTEEDKNVLLKTE